MFNSYVLYLIGCEGPDMMRLANRGRMRRRTKNKNRYERTIEFAKEGFILGIAPFRYDATDERTFHFIISVGSICNTLSTRHVGTMESRTRCGTFCTEIDR